MVFNVLRFECIHFLFAAAPLVFALVFYSHFYLYRRIAARLFRLENPMLKVIKQSTKRGKRASTLTLKLLLSVTLCTGFASPYLEVEKLQTVDVEAEVREVLKVARPAVVIVVDVSGSMSDAITGGVKISIAKSAILKFLDGIPANVSIGLIAFDDKIRLTVPVVRNVEPVKNAVMGLEPGGGTMYTYPLNAALNMLKPYRAFNASCTVVFVSDGLPADQGLYEDLLREMNGLNIAVNAIYIGPGGDPGAAEMQRIAKATGGQWFNAENAQQLIEIFERLSREVARRAVGFTARVSVTEKIIEKLDLSWCFFSASAILLFFLLYLRYRLLGLSI